MFRYHFVSFTRSHFIFITTIFAMAPLYKFTVEERIFLVKSYYKFDSDYESVCEEFAERFPDSPIPKRHSIWKMWKRIESTGTVVHLPRSGRPRTVSTEENLTEVEQTFVENPNKSAVKVSKPLDISRTSLCRVSMAIFRAP